MLSTLGLLTESWTVCIYLLFSLLPSLPKYANTNTNAPLGSVLTLKWSEVNSWVWDKRHCDLRSPLYFGYSQINSTGRHFCQWDIQRTASKRRAWQIAGTFDILHWESMLQMQVDNYTNISKPGKTLSNILRANHKMDYEKQKNTNIVEKYEAPFRYIAEHTGVRCSCTQQRIKLYLDFCFHWRSDARTIAFGGSEVPNCHNDH